MAGTAEHGLKMAGNGCKWLEMSGMDGNGWKGLKIGWPYDSF